MHVIYKTISPQDLRHSSFKRLPGCWNQHFLQLSFQDEAKVMKNSRTFSFLTWFVKIMVAAYQRVWLVCNCLRYFLKTDTFLSVQPTKVVNTNNSCEGMTINIVKSVAQNKNKKMIENVTSLLMYFDYVVIILFKVTFVI